MSNAHAAAGVFVKFLEESRKKGDQEKDDRNKDYLLLQFKSIDPMSLKTKSLYLSNLDYCLQYR